MDKKKKDDDPEGNDKNKKTDDGFPLIENMVNVIFGGNHGFDSRHHRKTTEWQILATEPTVLAPLKWMDTPFTFTREDQ